MRVAWQRMQPLVGTVGGALVLGVVLWRVSPVRVVETLGRIDMATLALVVAIAGVTTACVSWRWVLVARSFGLTLSLREAVMASYQSQFLNLSLPGGVAGDVRRAVQHGRESGALGAAARSVVWERVVGQVVQGLLTVAALMLLPSPLHNVVTRSPFALAVTLSLIAAAVTALVVVARRHHLRGPRLWPMVTVVSTVAVAGYVATFVIAARAAGAATDVADLVPVALVVLTAMAVPLNVAGWGPREGVAAWAFALAGSGAERGLATAVAYGGFALVASLPGAVLLAAARRNGRRQASPAAYPIAVVGGTDG